MVSGSPFSSCSWKIGTTLPFEPSTFPNRTETYGRPVRRAASATSISATRLLAPMTLDRSDRLVGRDEHEALDAGGDGRIEERQRAADIDVDRVGRMLLHHRHVLVGGGVEDDVWALGWRSGDPWPVGSPRSPGAPITSPLASAGARCAFELALDEVESALRTIDEDQPTGTERDRPGERAPNRSSHRPR